MKPEAWIWYWRCGWIVGPGLAIAGIAIGDALLIALGVVILALSLLMPRWFRHRIQDSPSSN